MIVCLQGGLGNQCFQYAFGRAVAMRLGAPLFLNLQHFSAKDPCKRMYSLNLWRGVTAPFAAAGIDPIREQGLPYNEDLLQLITPSSTLIGYWQSEKYFSEIADLLRAEFQPRQPLSDRSKLMLDEIGVAGNRSVFLTVRRTDYLTSDFHGVLGMDYYNAALAEIKKTQPNPCVFVFSDDPKWCRQHFRIEAETIIAGTFDRTVYPHLGREDEDLTLMRHCRHSILANSSFSWWGAWLNPEPGVVVAPAKWFLSTDEDPRDICPERWIRI